MHELQVIFFFVSTRLIRNAISSGIMGFVFGSAIGCLVGAIRQRIKDSVYSATIGAFVGSLCTCIASPGSQPGSLEAWGAGGGLGSLSVIFSIVMIALGGIVGALLASTLDFKVILKLNSKALGCTEVVIFVAMAIALYRGYRDYCFPESSFCS
jgi:hypothetical protein